MEQFNNFYARQSSFEYSQSLLNFFNLEVKKRIQVDSPFILDIGSGPKSIFEDSDFRASVDAIDFSEVAINKAQSSLNIKYQLKNIAEENIFLENIYDVIFDSHCLHCIVDKKERIVSFKNIYTALKPEGLFCAEMMIASSLADSPALIPHKYVPRARELEEEILGHGFRIIYFTIIKDLNFKSGESESDLVRVIAKK